MTWGEFKKAVNSEVADDEQLRYIDFISGRHEIGPSITRENWIGTEGTVMLVVIE